MERGYFFKCSFFGERVLGELGWLVLKEEGYIFRVEGDGFKGIRFFE